MTDSFLKSSCTFQPSWSHWTLRRCHVLFLSLQNPIVKTWVQKDSLVGWRIHLQQHLLQLLQLKPTARVLPSSGQVKPRTLILPQNSLGKICEQVSAFSSSWLCRQGETPGLWPRRRSHFREREFLPEFFGCTCSSLRREDEHHEENWCTDLSLINEHVNGKLWYLFEFEEENGKKEDDGEYSRVPQPTDLCQFGNPTRRIANDHQCGSHCEAGE